MTKYIFPTSVLENVYQYLTIHSIYCLWQKSLPQNQLHFDIKVSLHIHVHVRKNSTNFNSRPTTENTNFALDDTVITLHF